MDVTKVATVCRFYEAQFALFPDGRCDVTLIASDAVTGMVETTFHGTHARTGEVVTACGREVAQFVAGRIKELRDYHRLTET